MEGNGICGVGVGGELWIGGGGLGKGYLNEGKVSGEGFIE